MSHQYRNEEWLYEKYWKDGLSTGDISKICDVNRSTIVRWLHRHNIETRDTADYDQAELTKAARKAAQEKYGEGGALKHLWDNRTDEMLESVSKNAALGAAGREENGMKGVTGPDNPRWRGGKNLYDAVKKCIRRESWNNTRERARERVDRQCEMCGTTQPNRGLDVHHIVPLMCGGTNRDGNLMALCQSCHRIVEAHTRELFDPVLVE